MISTRTPGGQPVLIFAARRALAVLSLLGVAACATEPPPPPVEPTFLRTYLPEGAEDGDARYPIVMLIPGCLEPGEGSGAPHYERFAKRLADEGFFVGLISWRGSWPGHPGCAAYADAAMIAGEIDRAASVLRQSSRGMKERVHLVGWSHTALGVIEAIGKAHGADPAFRATTIIYPACPSIEGWTSDTSLQMLIAMKDDADAAACRKFADDADGPAPLALLEYDAAHGFDIRPSNAPADAWIFRNRDNSAYDGGVAEAAFFQTLKFLRIGDPRPGEAASTAGEAVLPPATP